MIFRQLFDAETSTYTYILGDEQTREAVLIDSVRDQVERDMQLLSELGLTLKYALETHVHADHIAATGILRQRTGCKVAVSKEGGTTCPDVLLADGDTISFGRHSLEVRSTPGHTDGDITYVLSDQSMAFTGDTLLIRGSGRTDFQQGDAKKLYRSVHERIFTLPDHTIVYPGHDYKGRTASTVGEEKAFNPRLGRGQSEADFVQLMSQLDLPKPKKIDIAVPANLQCGLTEAEVTQAAEVVPELAWADLYRTATGIPEVTVEWVAEHTEEVRLIDVRAAHEFEGELGHIAGAELVPLDTLEQQARAWDLSEPLVVVCRSGGRSGRAAHVLENMGFRRVASMAGGMIRWKEEGRSATSSTAA